MGKHGGKRANSGRKPRPRPRAILAGRDIAGEVLDSIDPFKYYRFLLRADLADQDKLETVDAVTRAQIERMFIYTTNRAHGKPVEAIVTDSGGLEKLAERLQAARNRK